VKVQRLIEKLQEFPPDAEVNVSWNGGNYMGIIWSAHTIEEEEREYWEKLGFDMKPDAVILGAGQ